MKVSFFLLILTCFSLLGCTINQKNHFDEIKIGMEKNDVLMLMESPTRSERWHGMDRWTYIFFEDDVRYEKEVHFLDGRATYVGDAYQPAMSAADRDKKLEIDNAEAEKLAKTKKEESRKAFIQYEDEAKGTDKTIRYVPEFKPVQ